MFVNILLIFLTFYFAIRLKGESEMIADQNFFNHEFNTKLSVTVTTGNTMHQFVLSSIFICTKFLLFLSF